MKLRKPAVYHLFKKLNNIIDLFLHHRRLTIWRNGTVTYNHLSELWRERLDCEQDAPKSALAV